MNGLPSKESLRDDLLYVFVLGPGTGESILIRGPGGGWLVIDSFRHGKDRVSAARSILSHYNGTPELIVLTHPHKDHFEGMIDLIDFYPKTKIGCVIPARIENKNLPQLDPVNALKSGAKPTYDRIMQEWTKSPERKWETFRHATWSIEGLRVTSLHPIRPVSSAEWSEKPNEISSAMLLEWEQARILLGADVPNTQWPGIAKNFGELDKHVLLKVPHHGSRDAIHESWGQGDRSRCWVVTPFASQRLPRVEDVDHNGNPEGIAVAHNFVDRIHLTSLPFRHEAKDHTLTTRQRVRDNELPKRVLDVGNSAPTFDELDCHVILAISSDGRIAEQSFGRKAVSIELD